MKTQESKLENHAHRRKIYISACMLVTVFGFMALQPLSAQSMEPFMRPGKWITQTEGYYCIGPNNQAPTPHRVAAQNAAGASTGDGRWIGHCKILGYNYPAHKHTFRVDLACTQTREKTGHKSTTVGPVIGLLKSRNEYIVKNGPSPNIKYIWVSKTCAPLPGYHVVVSPETPIKYPNRIPDLQWVMGLPKETFFYSKILGH